MSTTRVFNPDDYLWTPDGRVYTEERNAMAWEQMYLDLDAVLKASGPESRFFVVMGVQGGGKTSWIRANQEALGTYSIFMDAAVPARRHRAKALALARAYGVRTIAVWINTPLDQALRQNSRRPDDEIVPESAIRSVFSLLEAPAKDEGFDEVVVVTGDERGA